MNKETLELGLNCAKFIDEDGDKEHSRRRKSLREGCAGETHSAVQTERWLVEEGSWWSAEGPQTAMASVV